MDLFSSPPRKRDPTLPSAAAAAEPPPVREVVVDTETTGILIREGHRIVEIGCAEVVNRFATGRTWHSIVNPRRPIPPDAARIHGITDAVARQAPTFDEVADAFLAFVCDSAIVAHNLDFDLGHLDAELARCGRPTIASRNVGNVDTLTLARRRWPGADATLDAILPRCGVKTGRAGQLHGALLDATLLADAYAEIRGDRQGGLELAQQLAMLDGPETFGPRHPRPTRQLTDEERAAHAAFVATLGNAENPPIWNEYLRDEGE